MATILKMGPADHGRPMTLDEFLGGDYELGYHYELIDGRLYVAPLPNLPEDRVEEWLYFKLKLYAHAHPEVINYVTNKARVFVPGSLGVTAPEPDLAAFSRFPVDLPLDILQWQDVSPILVGEVLSSDDPNKDLVRNVELYHRVPTIKEYWLLDSREDPNQPRLRVHRRHGKKWRIIDLSYGDTYTTRLLPGFELQVDPQS